MGKVRSGMELRKQRDGHLFIPVQLHGEVGLGQAWCSSVRNGQAGYDWVWYGTARFGQAWRGRDW